MRIGDFVKALSGENISLISRDCGPRSLLSYTNFEYSDALNFSEYQLVILGVNDKRPLDENGGEFSSNIIRKHFYRLIKPRAEIKILDLGNIEAGNSFNDTCFALTSILRFLIQNKIICVVLGGSQELAHAQFSAYEKIKYNLNVIVADSGLDMNLDEENPLNSSFLPRIITHKANNLFNIAHIGHQSCLVDPDSYNSFEKMDFDIIRLGKLRNNIKETEPFCRNADMMIFNIASVKAADAPGQKYSSPNGFSAEESCQLLRYAGLGNELSSLGIFDIFPENDINEQTSKLAAQMMWYFLESLCGRKIEYPVSDSRDYMIYRTSIKNGAYEIVFYKNVKSDRWWMEVPYPNDKSKVEGKFLVPCTYADYETALADEIPDRWMKAYHKLF